MALVFDNRPQTVDFQLSLVFPKANTVAFALPADTVVATIAETQRGVDADTADTADIADTGAKYELTLWHWNVLNKYGFYNDSFQVTVTDNDNHMHTFDVDIGTLIALHLSGVGQVTVPNTVTYSFDIVHQNQLSNILEYQNQINLSVAHALIDEKEDIDPDADIDSLLVSDVSTRGSREPSSTPITSSPSTTSLSKSRTLGRYLKPKLFGTRSFSATEESLPIADDTVGYLIIQIESARNLPPFRKSTRLGYDMDPFVTCSFSKQIYKTSRCNHTLNPSWRNQYINLRISKYVGDLDFPVRFRIFDHDYITSNDAVCQGDMSIKEFLTTSGVEWIYKSIPLTLAPKALNRKLSRRSMPLAQPSLDIKYKYVPIETLSVFTAFNPREERCPHCGAYDKSNTSAHKHLSMCTSGIKPSYFIQKLYTTQSNASRGWYTKMLAHVVYGKLKLGKNNAHILVQDRDTGLIYEEKMSAWVKLGIRLIYKARKHKGQKIRKLLRSMSIKQGIRYDSEKSRDKIEDFVKFFGLDMSQCLEHDISRYRTFNDFFTRRLSPDARPIEGEDRGNEIVSLMADARTIVFDSVSEAQKVWIKGRGFTIEKLLGVKTLKSEYSVMIQRLAPQDYHRIHCPLQGVIKAVRHIHGEYYTVNPMAIRSTLDVFCENVRTVVTIATQEYGDVEIIFVGAMMVGSIIVSVELNQTVFKGQELGYFKFGGSTVVMLVNSKLVEWDGDLRNNSLKGLETLCRVGMSGGHGRGKACFERNKKTVNQGVMRAIERQVTGNRLIMDADDVPMWDVRELSLLDGVSDTDSELDDDVSVAPNDSDAVLEINPVDTITSSAQSLVL